MRSQVSINKARGFERGKFRKGKFGMGREVAADLQSRLLLSGQLFSSTCCGLLQATAAEFESHEEWLPRYVAGAARDGALVGVDTHRRAQPRAARHLWCQLKSTQVNSSQLKSTQVYSSQLKSRAARHLW